MQTKTFEIRDRATFIPALAIRYDAADLQRDPHVRALWWRVGFGPSHGPYIILVKLSDQEATSDPFEWADRTMTTAHRHIEATPWDELKDGQVVDVEFILKETDAPKTSEAVAL